jgi:hypothetical protein
MIKHHIHIIEEENQGSCPRQNTQALTLSVLANRWVKRNRRCWINAGVPEPVANPVETGHGLPKTGWPEQGQNSVMTSELG